MTTLSNGISIVVMVASCVSKFEVHNTQLEIWGAVSPWTLQAVSLESTQNPLVFFDKQLIVFTIYLSTDSN